MVKSNSNSGAARSAPATAKGARTSTKAKSTAKSTAAKSTAKRSTAGRQTAAPGSRAGAGSGTRRSATKQEGRQGAGPALHQIRKRQSPSQIIASASRAAGIDPRSGKVFTESFMTTIKRHLVPGAVGRVDVPGLNAALYRGMLPARKERTMMSPLLNREVTMPARPARPVPKFRAHPALREIVARV